MSSQLFNILVNMAVQNSGTRIVYIILSIIGTLYVVMLLIRGLLMAIVKLTPTLKDDAAVEAIYTFLDKYSMSFKRTEDFSVIKKDKKE